MTTTSNPNTELEPENGITGYWMDASGAYRCSVCLHKNRRVFRMLLGEDEVRVCLNCGIALREMLIDALEDE